MIGMIVVTPGIVGTQPCIDGVSIAVQAGATPCRASTLDDGVRSLTYQGRRAA